MKEYGVKNSMAKAEVKITHQNLDVLLIHKKVASVFQLAHRSHSDAQFCPKFLPLKKKRKKKNQRDLLLREADPR